MLNLFAYKFLSALICIFLVVKFPNVLKYYAEVFGTIATVLLNRILGLSA
jgi:hypothetical protein